MRRFAPSRSPLPQAGEGGRRPGEGGGHCAPTLRIAFITNPDGWEVTLYADTLRKHRHKVAAILVPLSPRPLILRLRQDRRRPSKAARPFSGRLIVHAVSERTRRLVVHYAALRRYARKHRIPLLHVWSLRSPLAARALRRARPDVLFAASLSHLVPPALIRVPRLAAVNIHGGLLPDYAGRDAAARALADRRTRVGVTFHRLTERFDSGPIVLSRAVALKGRPTAERLAERLIRLASDTLPECLDRIGAIEVQAP